MKFVLLLIATPCVKYNKKPLEEKYTEYIWNTSRDRCFHVILVMHHRRISLSTVLIDIHCHMPKKKKFLGSFENCLLSEKRLKVLKSSVVLMIEKCFINIHDAAQMDVCIASQRYYFSKSCSMAMSIAEILTSLFSSYKL